MPKEKKEAVEDDVNEHYDEALDDAVVVGALRNIPVQAVKGVLAKGAQ